MRHYDVLLARINELERRVAQLEARDQPVLVVSEDNISNPPTDAQLDAAFGTPAEVGEGFMGFVNDDGLNTTVYVVVSTGASWHYESFGLAS